MTATSPATAPEAAPTTLGFPDTFQLMSVQVRAAMAAATFVLTKA